MCGICCAIGENNKIFEVLSGLKKLEYRGYDSSGIGFIDENKKIKVIKSVGEIKNLEKKISPSISSQIVIGHTRWATHGKVSEENAHPHLSLSRHYAIVHNGIIENFEKLKGEFFPEEKFTSQTDTEILVNLIEKQEGSCLQKLYKACKLVKGSYALCLINDESKKMFLAKQKSPLMIAHNKEGAMASSDMSVFVGKFKECYLMADGEFAVADSNGVVFYDKNLNKIKKTPIIVQNMDYGEESNDEKYFMLKEIKEQARVFKRTYYKYFSENVFNDFDALRKYKSFHFVACGSAYHSSLIGAQYIQKFAKKPCFVSVSSEFRYGDIIFDKHCLYVFVSQSGETADTIACASMVKELGLDTLCITNVPYCSLNNFANYVLPTFAGKEVAVASTKAYTAQVFTMLILAIMISKQENLKERLENFVLNFSIKQPDESLFKFVFNFKKIFFLGRQFDYASSLEAALKMKEICYINCSGLAAGELKHGTLALVDKDTLIIVISTQRRLKEKIESNIQEIKAREGKVLLISNFEHDVNVDKKLMLPTFDEFLMPLISIIPTQFLALAYAEHLGNNPDKPRNLAKSVTVE